MGFMWQYLKKQHWYVLVSLIGTVGKVVVMMGLPTLLGLMIDSALISGDFERAITIGWWMLGLGIIGFVGRVVNTYGSSILSKGGSGDVLSGLIASLLAQGYETLDAAITASLAHTLAANNYKKNNYSFSPQDLIEEIKKI